jgi:hypothetical protein
MENWGLIPYGEDDLLYNETRDTLMNQRSVATIIGHETAHLVSISVFLAIGFLMYSQQDDFWGKYQFHQQKEDITTKTNPQKVFVFDWPTFQYEHYAINSMICYIITKHSARVLLL